MLYIHHIRTCNLSDNGYSPQPFCGRNRLAGLTTSYLLASPRPADVGGGIPRGQIPCWRDKRTDLSKLSSGCLTCAT